MAIRAEFTRDLLTDDEMIDAQHKELFEKINALFESCEGGKGAEETMNTLNYLVDYTKFHFGAEEKLQEEIDFPDFNQHKTEHRRLIEAVDDLKAKLEKEGATPEFQKELNERMVQWLYGHIRGYDRAVAAYKKYKLFTV